MICILITIEPVELVLPDSLGPVSDLLEGREVRFDLGVDVGLGRVDKADPVVDLWDRVIENNVGSRL